MHIIWCINLLRVNQISACTVLSSQKHRRFTECTGTGAWDRNAEEMEFMYMDSFKTASGGEEKFEMLGLYAKKMRYSITTWETLQLIFNDSQTHALAPK